MLINVFEKHSCKKVRVISEMSSSSRKLLCGLFDQIQLQSPDKTSGLVRRL